MKELSSKMVRFYRNERDGEETCFNIEVSRPLSAEQLTKLKTFLVYNHERNKLSDRSFLHGNVNEVGPRLAFATSHNSNALSILHSIGLTKISRIE